MEIDEVLNEEYMFQRIAILMRQKRLEKKLTLVQLAKLSGLHPVSLAKWENGMKRPSLASLVKLAKGLGTNIHDFCKDI